MQVCRALTINQIQMALTSKFVTMATSKGAKETLVGDSFEFNLNLTYFYLTNIINTCAKFGKNLYKGFGDM